MLAWLLRIKVFPKHLQMETVGCWDYRKLINVFQTAEANTKAVKGMEKISLHLKFETKMKIK